MPSERVSNNQVLKEVQALRQDLTALSKLLIGCADEPDKPGMVERMRSLETNQRMVKWIACVAIVVVIGDVVTRAIALYRGLP
jgi:hypothetical protein